jgi:transcriptional regulator of arginine metabolism
MDKTTRQDLILRLISEHDLGTQQDVVSALADEGVEVAFTTERGVNDLRRPDWLRLRRINVGRRSSVGAIRLQVLASARFGATNGLRPRGVA